MQSHRLGGSERPAPVGEPSRIVRLNGRYRVPEQAVGPDHGVLRAWDERYRRAVAIQVIPLADDGARARLLDRVAAFLDLPPHPGLPEIRDEFAFEGPSHCLVTDWVDAVPLGHGRGPAAYQGRWTAESALGPLGQLAEILELMHAGGKPLVHGELSPAVVRIAADERVVVLGVGATGGPVRAPQTAALRYLAPEILAGEQPTVASDVYGLAALARLLLTGSPPGGGEPLRLGAPCAEPRLVEQLLRAGMARDPAARPGSPTEFMERLRLRFDRVLPTGTVTFLLTDISGSTELWDTAPDTTATAVERHDQVCAEVIERHGGFLPRDQGEGDSVLVVFPAASDAVACAYELQRRLSADEWLGSVPLRVRMALHTGEAKLHNDNYRGAAVNLCARLRAAAHGGQVLMSRATAELARPLLPNGLELVDLGVHELRNVRRPERVFELRGPGIRADFPSVLGPTPGAAASPAQGSARLLGWGAELGTLFEALDLAEQGRPQTVLVTGESGVGKSSLCAEAAEHARRMGAVVVWTRGVEGECAPAYWLWRQVVSSLLEEWDDAELVRYLDTDAPYVAQFFPEVARRLDLKPPPLSGDPEADRFRQYFGLVGFLRRVATTSTLMLIHDDLQWADESSLRLLELVTEQLADVRLLTVAAYTDRASPGSRQLAHTVAGLARKINTTRLTLGGLSRAQVGYFIESVAGGAAEPGVVDAVYATSEGNLFFVRELVRLLAAEGKLDGRGFDGRVSLPQSVRDVIRRRVDLVSADCAELLELAAVVGRELRLDLLVRVSAQPTERILSALDEAISAGLIVMSPDRAHRYSFSHNLIRRAVYESLNVAVRVRLHLAVAEALETESNPSLGEIAYHLAEAGPWGDLGRTVAAARRAAEHAVSENAYEDGARLYHVALTALELDATAAGGLRIELMLAEGNALWHAGNLRGARQRVLEATRLAIDAGDRDQVAVAARRLANNWSESGVVDRQDTSVLRTALDLTEDAQQAARAEMYSRLAIEQCYAEDPTLSVEQSETAVRLARESGDPRATAFALIARRYALARPGLIQHRLAAINESCRLAAEAGDTELGLRARMLRLLDLHELGMAAETRAEAHRLVQETAASQQPQFMGLGSAVGGFYELVIGSFERARRHIDATLKWAEWSGRRAMSQAALFQLTVLYREQGRVVEVLPKVRQSASQFPLIPGWLAMLAVLHLDVGDPERAREALDELGAGAQAAVVRDTTWLANACLLAEAWVRLGEREQCARLYEQLAPFGGRAVVAGIATPVVGLGALDRILGRLAAADERWDEADDHLTAAIRFDRETGARPWVAHALYDRARLLFTRRRQDDTNLAQRLLSEALRIAKRLEMPVLADRIDRTWRERDDLSYLEAPG